MVSNAQRRLAHFIASMGVCPYNQAVHLMEEKSPLVGSYKAIRKEFDEIYAERLLLQAYLFARKGTEWTEFSFDQALWAYMRQYHEPAAKARVLQIQESILSYRDEHSLDLQKEDQQLTADADRYLLERIAFCLQDSPYVEEWQQTQVQAHQNYEFWWTRRDPKEGEHWRQTHPRTETQRLWKIPPTGPGSASPMVCHPGTIEYTLAEVKLAHAQLEAWMRRFGSGAHDQEEARQVLRHYATHEMEADDVHLLGLSGQLSKAQIVEAIEYTMQSYIASIPVIREADVPLVLRHPVDPWEHTVRLRVKEWNHFLQRLQALEE